MDAPQYRWSLVAVVAVLLSSCQPATAQKSESTTPAANSTAPQATEASLKSTRPGEDWPQFLGPEGNGTSHETGLLESWPEAGPPMLWNHRLGEGYAPPAVQGERVVVMHRQRDQEFVECFHAQTGESLWKYGYDTDYEDPYGYNGGSRCAPVLTADRCYTFGPQGKLLCLDLIQGTKVWEIETTERWDIPRHFFGAGCTPILEGNMLIVLIGGQPNSGVVAFDAATGKVLWESVGKATWDGAKTDEPGNKPYEWTGREMLVSYSTPICATIHGERHLLCLMRQGLVSLNPADGTERFHYWFRSRTHESVNAARPVVVDDTILLSAAYETGAALLKVKPDNQSFDVVWRNKRGLSTHWSTAVVHNGYAYGFSGRHEDEAELQCIDWQTGDLQWQTNGFAGKLADLGIEQATGRIVDRTTGQPVTFFGRGSTILVDGKAIILAERGTLILARLTPEKYTEISRVKFPEMGYPSWAAPVLSRGRLFLRSESHIVCVDVAKPGE
ncbi:PQQ-binding-like beta-propeller repeat protein [bacterium]|nr:PQQ-binding-like beta-propeller repeat protein [bacterium]